MNVHRNRLLFYRQRRARDDMERLAQKQLPLAAFYGRSEEFEGSRHLFYDRCAKVFGWKGWDAMSVDLDYDDLVVARSADDSQPLPPSGFGGRKRDVAAIERNRVIAINLNSSPFEWLASHGRLETKSDPAGIGNIRFSAGIKLRDLLIGAEPAGLRSANLEGGSGGGTAFVISDFKLDCVTAVARLREDMRAATPRRWSRLKHEGDWEGEPTFNEQYSSTRSEQFSVLERLIYRDEWLFDGLNQKKQKAVMDQIHNGLDQVALFFGMITPREYAARWKPKDERKAEGQHRPSSSSQ